MSLSRYKRQTPALGGGLEGIDDTHQKHGLAGFLAFANARVILNLARDVILLGH